MRKIAALLIAMVITLGCCAVSAANIQTFTVGGKAALVLGVSTAQSTALTDATKNAVRKALNLFIDQDGNNAAVQQFIDANYQQVVVESPRLLSKEMDKTNCYVVAAVKIDMDRLQQLINNDINAKNSMLRLTEATKANVAFLLRVTGCTFIDNSEGLRLVKERFEENFRELGFQLVAADSADSAADRIGGPLPYEVFRTQMYNLAAQNPGWTYLVVGQIAVDGISGLNAFYATASVNLEIYDNKQKKLIKKTDAGYAFSAMTVEYAEPGLLIKSANSESRSVAEVLAQYYSQQLAAQK
jgi:hypothetical protein